MRWLAGHGFPSADADRRPRRAAAEDACAASPAPSSRSCRACRCAGRRAAHCREAGAGLARLHLAARGLSAGAGQRPGPGGLGADVRGADRGGRGAEARAWRRPYRPISNCLAAALAAGPAAGRDPRRLLPRQRLLQAGRSSPAPSTSTSPATTRWPTTSPWR